MAEITGDQRVQAEVLEGLATAVNHRRWFVELALPHLGEHPIEVGSGLGYYALDWAPHFERFTATEADPDRLVLLKEKLKGYPHIDVRQLLLPSEESGQYSGAVSYNVLEHIEDHVGALRSMRQLVRPGGKIVLLVPAFLSPDAARLGAPVVRTARPRATGRRPSAARSRAVRSAPVQVCRRAAGPVRGRRSRPASTAGPPARRSGSARQSAGRFPS